MPDTFALETRDGIRKIEFDPDVFRHRDVRILVDGKRVAEIPFPKAASPYAEVVFQLGEHALVAVANLSTDPGRADSFSLKYDLFANGRSLTDGATLAEARARAPAPGDAYPGRFHVIDTILQVAPVAAVPGAMVALVPRTDEMGWPMVIALLGLILGAGALATLIAGRAWARIRGDGTRSVTRRATLGWAVVLGCYFVAGAAVIALGVVIGQGMPGG